MGAQEAYHYYQVAGISLSGAEQTVTRGAHLHR